jgi:hypothetical protein
MMEYEVGRACGMYGRGEKSVQSFVKKARRKEITRKTETSMGGWDQMDVREICWEGVEWIHLAQDRDRWRTLVNTVMNLRVLVPCS